MHWNFRVGPLRVSRPASNLAVAVVILVGIMVCICAPCIIGVNFA